LDNTVTDIIVARCNHEDLRIHFHVTQAFKMVFSFRCSAKVIVNSSPSSSGNCAKHFFLIVSYISRIIDYRLDERISMLYRIFFLHLMLHPAPM